MKFSCPHCGQRVSASQDLSGTTTTCPGCGGTIQVPVFPEPHTPPSVEAKDLEKSIGPAERDPTGGASGKSAAAKVSAPGAAFAGANSRATDTGAHRYELDVPKLDAAVRERLLGCLSGHTHPQPLWSVPAPVEESWKILLPVGLILFIAMALIGSDAVLGWPWIAGWFLPAALLAVGVANWQRERRNAARLGCTPGIYLFASDLIEARDGVCTLYNLDRVTQIKAKSVYKGVEATESEVDFVFGREVVAIRMPGKQTAQLIIDKFWPAREIILTSGSVGDWGKVARVDPLFEARHADGWKKICRPQAAAFQKTTTLNEQTGRSALGMPPAVLTLGIIIGIFAAPVLWLASNVEREALAFSRARSRDTVGAWTEYLKRDAPAHYLQAKQDYLPKAALREAKKKGTAGALRDFLTTYGDTAVAPEAVAALHGKYEQAILQLKTKTPESSRSVMEALLRWLDAHRTNAVQVRFGSNSEEQMKAVDGVLRRMTLQGALRAPIEPVGPSLSEDVMTRREVDLVSIVQSGFASIISPDLLYPEKGGTFSGSVAGMDEPALTLTCYTDAMPQLIADFDTGKYYLRLAFNVEFNLVAPGTAPFTSAFEVTFADKIPKTRGKKNFYDGMLQYTFEEAQQRIAESFFPGNPPKREMELLEIPVIPPVTSGLVGTATGFCISPDGFIVTARHFTSAARTYKVITKDGAVEAHLVTADANHDLAVLKVAYSFPVALTLRSSQTVKLGDDVATIGYPQTQLQGREPKVGRGEISGLSGMHDDPSLFQVSVPVQPGNSGGPLLDLNGNVGGVVVSVLRQAQVVNYAIKSQHLIDLCGQIPELRELAAEASGSPPVFADMIERVRQATVLIEGYQ